MICPQCKKKEGRNDPEYGALKCEDCLAKDRAIRTPSQKATFDFASPTTKEQRQSHGSEMYQPWVNGVLSKEFIEVNGTDRLAGVTKEDIKNAKYVYKGMTRHHRTLENGKQGLNRNPQLKDDYKVVEHEDKA